MMSCSSTTSHSLEFLDMMKTNKAQHTFTLTLPVTEDDESVCVMINQCDDQSVISSLSCSVQSCRMKRTYKTMNLNSYQYDADYEYTGGEHDQDPDTTEQNIPNKRRRGAGYNVVEIHSLLHLMKRVLPKCADEWEIIRIVHNRIFPNNDRTVTSLKKKYRDLCRQDTRNNAGSREVAKAIEVQRLILQKPPGFQLVLPHQATTKVAGNGLTATCKTNLNSLPSFQVKVPDPLRPKEQIPEFIQVPESPPDMNIGRTSLDDDELSELDLDEYEADTKEMDSVIIKDKNNSIQSQDEQNLNTVVVISTPCATGTHNSKTPAIIVDHK